jgi:hypothetical protein
MADGTLEGLYLISTMRGTNLAGGRGTQLLPCFKFNLSKNVVSFTSS